MSYLKIEDYYRLKAVLEKVWGREVFQELKHSDDLPLWKKHLRRTLKASLYSIQNTVSVCDEIWKKEAYEIIAFGDQAMESSVCLTSLFQSALATYIELSFHQLGGGMQRPVYERTLHKKGWKHDAYRTVQYVQDDEQKNLLNSKKNKC